MKYVEKLSESEEVTLTELMRHHTNARVRMRAHAILLSHRRFKINEIARIYAVDRDTTSRWLADWETHGLIGLYDDDRCGRPPKLTALECQKVKELIEKENPRSMKIIAIQVIEFLHKVISVSTLRRIARQMCYCWKRIRKSLKAKRQQNAFSQAKADIEELRALEQAKIIDLYFFDETGFSLQPMVPYAWQPKGETLGILPSHSPRLNVLGFMSANEDFDSFVVQGRVDTEVVIACFDEFSQHLSKTTWVVLDNAAHHTSFAFKAQMAKWQKQKLFLFYLPPYSPELNLIEILWRFIKYAWLPFSAYKSFNDLQFALDEILINIGKKYHVTFG